MLKPICVPCERFMRCKKSGFYFLEGRPNGGDKPWDNKRGKGSVGWTPYKVWSGDLFECPTCKAQTIAGVGQRPLAEHYQPEFADTVKRTGAHQLMVKDC
jgi:hypothetical protein